MSGSILRGLSDIRDHFANDERPLLFVGPTCFNLLGMDEWVRSLRFVSYIDCFDGEHPRVVTPVEIPHRPFAGVEYVNNYLLEHREVIDLVRSQTRGRLPPRAAFLMFDERTEDLCRELGLELIFPSAALRRRIDDKLSATRIAARAGIEAVPNVLAPIESYASLRGLAGHLGESLVIQTAFGDSGHTTFFVSSEAEFARHAHPIVTAPEVKVMRRIRCRSLAQEACVTRHGTIVGPLMSELVGFPELTPYPGGWCGNQLLPDEFPSDLLGRARRMTAAFGEELRRMDYRGYFELDLLWDLDRDRLYLGEANPRLTGVSPLTNLAADPSRDLPLFLFHLLEWSGADYDLDLDAINARWASPDDLEPWSQLVIKHTADTVERVIEAPRSGIWRLMPDGSAAFVRAEHHRRAISSPDEALFLRIMRQGDDCYRGADLGVVILPCRLMTDRLSLEPLAMRWIGAMRARFRTRPAGVMAPHVASEVARIGSFKSS